jgi:hypothetical protein
MLKETTAPDVFNLIVDGRLTTAHLNMLKSSLPGIILLCGYDRHYVCRFFAWLFWCKWVKKAAPDTLRAEAVGGQYRITGGTTDIVVHERILASTWAGRLLILDSKNNFLFLYYFVQDLGSLLCLRSAY